MPTMSINAVLQTKDPHLYEIAKNLIRKDLITDQFKKRILDPSNFQAAVMNYKKESLIFSQYSCPNCMILIKGPKNWLIEHHKKCQKVEKRFKENEVITEGYHVY